VQCNGVADILDQIRRGNTYGDGFDFRSATPLHLHKCVARFVGDSKVSFFSSPTAITKLQREPAQREHKYNWGGEIMKISPFISETVRDRAIVITEH